MSARSCRVLLVEDHPLVTDALTILLEAGGHEVRTADSVATAVERGREWRPELLLLDLTLPDGHGLELLPRLAAVDASPAIVVALTGHEDPGTIAHCRAAGCRDVLLKPVPARELLALVAGWAAELADARDADAGAMRPRPPTGAADHSRRSRAPVRSRSSSTAVSRAARSGSFGAPSPRRGTAPRSQIRLRRNSGVSPCRYDARMVK